MEITQCSLLVVFKCVLPFLHLLTYLINKLQWLKIYVLKGDILFSAKMEIVFTELLLLEEMKQNEKHKGISPSSPSLFQKNPKVFELPLFAIFNYKYSHCFFNTKIFYSDFFGWSNLLIMEVYCNCTIPFNAVLGSQHISWNHHRHLVKIDFLLISLFVCHVCWKQNIYFFGLIEK